MPRTNADSGSTAFGLGGLTINEGTILNGATWTSNGLQFVSSSSQYMTIPDFLGSETLTVFARVSGHTQASLTTQGVVGQYSFGDDNRSKNLLLPNTASGSEYNIRRSSDGTSANLEIYQGGTPTTADQTLVVQWVDGGGRSFWQNKTIQSISRFFGSDQTSSYNTSINVDFGCERSSGTPTNFADQTAHALAFITGTVTTAQRETITDLINMIGKPPPLEALREYVAETGATDTLTLDRLTRYISDEGLWDNFALYSMMPDTNYNSGSTVKVLGGLTSNDMTLVNGPTWGASGLAFASASSQYGSIADFLGSETLTVWNRSTVTGITSGARAEFGQYDGGASQASFVVYQAGNTTGDPIRMQRNAVGSVSPITNLEAYDGSNAGFYGVDRTGVFQWIDGGGRNLWLDNSSISLSLSLGATQTSRFNSTANFTYSASLNSGSAGSFADQTAHALAFITGTVTDTQRETITDLINEL
jgi:hypothetical protein